MRKIRNHGIRVLWPVSFFRFLIQVVGLNFNVLYRFPNRLLSSCYTITCLWREAGGMQTILFTTCQMYIRLPYFWSYYGLTLVCLVNAPSVDCNTSRCHLDLAAVFHWYPSTFRSRDDNHIPLHLNTGTVFDAYSTCAAFGAATFKRESWWFNKLLWCDN